MYDTSANANASKDPSRPVLVYDDSIDETEVRLLQWAYLNANSPNIPGHNVLRLFTKLAFVYGSSMSHPSLRHAACAYLSDGLHFGKPPMGARKYRDYSVRAVQALKRRLQDPIVVDEGDLFAVSLLALPVHIIDQAEFVMHMDGFIALATHLSKNEKEHVLRAFWPLARDEMIAFGYQLSLNMGNIKSMTYHLCRLCPVGNGYEAFQERQKYQSLVYGANIAGCSTSSLDKTSRQQLLFLRRCLHLVAEKGFSAALDWYNSDIGSILMDVRDNLHPIDEERMLQCFAVEVTGMREKEKREYKPDTVDAAVGLLRLLLCRLLIIVLESRPINQALNSENAIAAAARLTSFIVRVYNMAFPSSNREASMTDIAIGHTAAALNFRHEDRNIYLVYMIDNLGEQYFRLSGDCVFGEWFAFHWWHSVVECLDILDGICLEQSNLYKRWLHEQLYYRRRMRLGWDDNSKEKIMVQ
jgi:hypothetical protein